HRSQTKVAAHTGSRIASRPGVSPRPVGAGFNESAGAAQQADEAVGPPRFRPTGHGGGALRVLALRRAPGARSLSAVLGGHLVAVPAEERLEAQFIAEPR